MEKCAIRVQLQLILLILCMRCDICRLGWRNSFQIDFYFNSFYVLFYDYCQFLWPFMTVGI